jgi:hypothetical protein
MSTTDPVSTSAELSREQVCLVRDHLMEIIVSPAFAGSKRAQDFLQLIVEHAVAGRLDNLRERMIGAEMFGRPVDYDTANDAVVRVKATEVRRKLAQYYQEAEKQPAVRIELPVGSYVPRFQWEFLERLLEPPTESAPVAFAESAATQDTAHATGETASRTPRVLIGALAGLAFLATAGYIGFTVWPKRPSTRPEVHSIAILPLENLSGDSQQDYFADGMTEELISDLGQVSALRVISRTSAMSYKGTKKTLPEIARELAVDAVVEGFPDDPRSGLVHVLTGFFLGQRDVHAPPSIDRPSCRRVFTSYPHWLPPKPRSLSRSLNGGSSVVGGGNTRG